MMEKKKKKTHTRFFLQSANNKSCDLGPLCTLKICRKDNGDKKHLKAQKGESDINTV